MDILFNIAQVVKVKKIGISLKNNKIFSLSLLGSLLLMVGCTGSVEDETKIAVEKASSLEKQQVSVKRSLTDDGDLMAKLMIKTIKLNVIELKDSTGLVYIGAQVTESDVSVYLDQLESILGDEFEAYRANQIKRDHHAFHVTLINPYEYKELALPISVGDSFSVDLLGLGAVKKESQATYFVVAQSNWADEFRKALGLSAKDLHVTLGFKPNDIYGVSKNAQTLIHNM